MATSWHDTVTWKSGLVYELPVITAQTISGNDATEIILCEKSNANQPLSPANIKRRQTISAGEMGKISWWETILKSASQYSCIVVDMRLRTHKVDCSFSTNDPVKGNATIHISYHVTSSKKVVFDIEDALANLTTLCQKTVVAIAKKHGYKEIMEDSIFEDELKNIDVDKFGLEIDDVHIPDQINFPSNLVDIISQPPILIAKDNVKNVERDLLVRKLRNMGLPENIITVVQASKDDDLKIMFDAANAFLQNKRQNKQDTLDFLRELIDKGLVPRAMLEDGLLEKVIAGAIKDDTEDANPLEFFFPTSKSQKSLPAANKDNVQPSTNDSTDNTSLVDGSTSSTEIIENNGTFSVTRRPAKPRSSKKEN